MSCSNCPGPHVPHRCKKKATLSEEIAALKVAVIKGKRHKQPHFVPRTLCLAPGRAKEQVGTTSNLSTRALNHLSPSHHETHKSERMDDGESTVDDGQSVLSRDSEAVPSNALPLVEDSHIVRLLWAQAGIDSLRRQGMWEQYGRPEVGHELSLVHRQLLQDSRALGDMVRANFFADAEQQEEEASCERNVLPPPPPPPSMASRQLRRLRAPHQCGNACCDSPLPIEDASKIPLLCEPAIGDGTAIHSSPVALTKSASVVATGARDETKRYLWSRAGVDKLKDQGRWEEYGSPQACEKVQVHHLQTLQDTGKLAAMVGAAYFLDEMECCFADWEPPCMACPSCDDFLGVAKHPC